MPGGKTHDMLTVVTAAAGLPALWALTPGRNLAAALVWAGAHLVSGMAFSPDLDLASEPYKRWGPLRYIWYPYREFIPHRAWISHSLVFGPLIRLAYFLAMCALSFGLVVLALNYVVPVDGRPLLREFAASVGTLWRDHRPMVGYFLLGFISGGAVHTAADWLSEDRDPYHRPLRRPGRRSRRRDDEWGIW